MQAKSITSQFIVGQTVICILGFNKGRKFIIKEVTETGYTCVRADKIDGKEYYFNDQWLQAEETN